MWAKFISYKDKDLSLNIQNTIKPAMAIHIYNPWSTASRGGAEIEEPLKDGRATNVEYGVGNEQQK